MYRGPVTDDNSDGNGWARYPFESADLGEKRLVWDQVVHEFAGEGCSFWLFSWSGKTSELEGHVRALLKKADIENASVYVLYGYYDVLVRAWVTPSERELFTSLLFGEDVRALARFDSFEIDYSRWSMVRGEATSEDVAEYLNEIHRLASGAEFTQGDINQVLEAGLVHVHDTRELEGASECLKVYLAFSQPNGNSEVDAAKRALRIDQVIGELEFLLMPSVYFGRGPDFYCLVKGFIAPKDIGDLYSHVDELEGRLAEQGLELEPMTLITARYKSESDFDGLRLERQEVSVEERQLRSFLSEEAAYSWTSLDGDFRNSVLATFGDHWEAVRTTPASKDLLLRLVETAVLQDKQMLNATLSMLFDIERLLRDWVVTDLFPQALGASTWREQVVSFFMNLGDTVAAQDSDDSTIRASLHHKRAEAFRDPKRASLGAIYYGLRELVKGEIIEPGLLSIVLEENWDPRLSEVLGLRNQYAHAEFWDDNYVKNGQLWAELADKVMRAGEVRMDLEKVTGT